MPESLPENRLPINQACRQKLQEADPSSDPDPSKLYLLQMAAWALEQPALRPTDGNLLHRLESQVGDLWSLPAEKVMRLAVPQGVPGEDLAADLMKKDPQAAAKELLTTLAAEMNLV